jgi:PAS domain S-box-containing protein
MVPTQDPQTASDSTGRTYAVLVVDDSEEIRTLVRLHLEATGCFRVVGEAANGEQAVERAAALQPEAIVLDVSMPKMDGFEALVHIRRQVPTAAVFMFTGFVSSELRQKALDLGAADFLNKGTDLRILAARIVDILGERVVEVQSRTSEADQNKLLKHRERFREIFDNTAIGLATLTLTGRIARVNQAGAELLGKAPEALAGEQLEELIAVEAVQPLRELLLTSEGQGRTHTLEMALPATRRLVLASLTPVRDDDGSPLYVLLQLQDVTALRGVESALASWQDRFRLLVESVRDYAIFLLDGEGHVSSWNIGAQRIKGYEEQEILGKHFSIFYTAADIQRGHPAHILARAARDGRYRERGLRVRSDGTTFLADVTVTAMFEGGQLVGFGKVTRDLGAPEVGLDESAVEEVATA